MPASRRDLNKDLAAVPRIAFTGTLRRLKDHDPGLAHPNYLVERYRVSLRFVGKQWSGLTVEASDPEVGDGSYCETPLDSDLHGFAERFHFGELKPVRLVELEYQIAQKIHALTDPHYCRPHDLVDLQILWQADPDMSRLRTYCERTFRFRSSHSWPPLPLPATEGWELAYVTARNETMPPGRGSSYT